MVTAGTYKKFHYFRKREHLSLLHDSLYMHHNAVHHKLVYEATDYEWGSACWFQETAAPLIFSNHKFFQNRPS